MAYSTDLPFIQVHEESILDYPSWQPYGVEANPLVSRNIASGKSINIYGMEIPVEVPTHGMYPMERYLHEQAPFPSLLHTGFNRPVRTPPLQQLHRVGFHNVQTPFPATAEFRRAPSPGATSSSRSQSLSPHEETKSLVQVHSYTYGTPPDSTGYNSMPYPDSVGDYYSQDRYMPETLLGGGSSCIALQDIQGVPDAIADQSIEEQPSQMDVKFEMHMYPGKMEIDHHSCCDEDAVGEVVEETDSIQDSAHYTQDEDSDQDYKPQTHAKRGCKRTLSQASFSSTPKRGSTKRTRLSRTAGTVAVERTSRSKRAKRSGAASSASAATKSANEENRPFPCPLAIYGCSATFSSKNEWKRHVSTQHVRLAFWRCDLCPPSHDATQTAVYYNDFNRKDLFAQHLRRMHSSAAESKNTLSSAHDGSPIPPVNETTLPEHQRRCYQQLRSAPPASSCLFCTRIFSGAGSWDERMEHVGRHLEKEGKGTIHPSKWRDDRVLRNWLTKEGLIEKVGEREWKIGDGVAKSEVEDNDTDENDEEEEDDVDAEGEDD